MDKIPPLAWIAIIVVALITIVIYLGLFAMLQNRGQMKDLNQKIKTRPPGRAIQTIQQIKEVARDPFRQEREQLDELSKLVSKMNQPGSSSEDTQNQPPRQEPPKAP